MNSRELLEKIRTVYSNLDSYCDAGTIEQPGSPGPAMEFKTYFKRPLNFHYEWISWHPYFNKASPAMESAVWTDGTKFRMLLLGNVQEQPNLPLMIAGAGGISGGGVLVISNLLLPHGLEIRNIWYEMSEPRFLDDETISNVDCFHIIGTATTKDDVEAWIEKDRFIVRRLRRTIVISERAILASQALRETDLYKEKLTESLKNAGLSEDELANALKIMGEKVSPTLPSRSVSRIYNYNVVALNQSIEDTHFTN